MPYTTCQSGFASNNNSQKLSDQAKKYKWTYLKTWFYLGWKLFETLLNDFQPFTKVDDFGKVSFVHYYIISKKLNGYSVWQYTAV